MEGACDSLEGPLEAGFSFNDALLLEVPVLFKLKPPARILPIPPCLTPYEANLNASSIVTCLADKILYTH